MTIPFVNDLKDAIIVVGFIATWSVAMWRLGVAEATLKDHAKLVDLFSEAKATSDQIHLDHERRLTRLENRAFNGGPR